MKFKLASIFLLAATMMWADQITLSNGDKLTGTIVKSDTKELVLKTTAANEVKIQWSAITGITADGPVYVGLSDGQTVAGAITATGGQVQVRTQTAGTVTAPLANVTSLRNQAEQTAHETEVERLRNPGLLDLWGGFLDLGYAATSGNAKTQTFTLSSRAERSTKRDKIAVYYTSIFSSNSTAGPKLTTAN